MESELSRVVDALPGLVWTASLGGEIDFLNRQWSDYTGFSRDKSYGKGWQAAVHPDELDETVRRWNAITGCGEPGEMVVRLRRFDGVVSAVPDAGFAGHRCGRTNRQMVRCRHRYRGHISAADRYRRPTSEPKHC